MPDNRMDDVDIQDIARGRRITAVVAREMEMTPRRTDRPRRAVSLRRLNRRLAMLFGKKKLQ